MKIELYYGHYALKCSTKPNVNPAKKWSPCKENTMSEYRRDFRENRGMIDQIIVLRLIQTTFTKMIKNSSIHL